MTPVDKDDFEDAELARRLAAMPQPEPSAELDAAIFAQIQKDLSPSPAAANDPAKEPAAEAPRPGLLRRYRAPLAFAASLAGIMILMPVWRTTQQKEIVPVETRIIAEDAPSANIESAAPSAVLADKKLDAMPAPKMEMPAPPPPPVPAPAPAVAAAAPHYEPPAPPAPAPVAESDALARQAPARGIEASHQSPKEWLEAIEHLLDAGETGPAAEQWKRFRKAHPDYPVPDTLAGRLKALE